MSVLEALIPIAIGFAIVAVSPGPANIATATIAMRFGRAKSIPFGMGLAVGLAFWGVVAATGLSTILQSSVYVLTGLKIFGGLYLLWLAYSSARSAVSGTTEDVQVTSQKHWFWRGLVLNLSNPKAVLAWMAALSMGLGDVTADAGTNLLMLATVLCMILGFANYMLYASAFSLPWFMNGYRKSARFIEGTVAALFAMAGFGLLRSALTR